MTTPTGRPQALPVSAVAELPATSAERQGLHGLHGRALVLLAIVLYVVRNSVSAADLKVGDCFDVPTGATIKTVDHHPCTESHTAEVILVADYTGTTYPISLSLDRFIEESCVPAFTSYIGREIDAVPDLSIGYFYPSRDSWDGGDRTITCYVARSDEAPMAESVKGSATL